MVTGKQLVSTLTADLTEMGLRGMAAALEEMYYAPDFLELDSLSAIAKLIEPEYQAKATKKLTNRLRGAHLLGCPQEVANCVDSADRAYLPPGITPVLASLDFIESGLNVCVLGPSDSGKSYLAKALGISACTRYRVIYFHCEQLLESMVMLKERDYPKYQKQLKKVCGQDLLILDDFLLHTLTDERELGRVMIRMSRHMLSLLSGIYIWSIRYF